MQVAGAVTWQVQAHRGVLVVAREGASSSKHLRSESRVLSPLMVVVVVVVVARLADSPGKMANRVLYRQPAAEMAVRGA